MHLSRKKKKNKQKEKTDGNMKYKMPRTTKPTPPPPKQKMNQRKKEPNLDRNEEEVTIVSQFSFRVSSQIPPHGNRPGPVSAQRNKSKYFSFKVHTVKNEKRKMKEHMRSSKE